MITLETLLHIVPIWKEVKQLVKAERYVTNGEHDKAHKVLESISSQDKIYRPIGYRLIKLKLDFLTYKFDIILEEYQALLRLLDKSKQYKSSQKNYRKAYVYSIVYLIYRLHEEREEAKKYLNEMRNLEIEETKISDRFLFQYTPITRLNIKRLFKSKHYQDTYSKKLLDEIRYDSGELGFIEDLFIIEGSDTIGMFLKLTKYLLIFMSVIAVSVWFIRMGMVQTAMAFAVLSALIIYMYLEYRGR